MNQIQHIILLVYNIRKIRTKLSINWKLIILILIILLLLVVQILLFLWVLVHAEYLNLPYNQVLQKNPVEELILKNQQERLEYCKKFIFDK